MTEALREFHFAVNMIIKNQFFICFCCTKTLREKLIFDYRYLRKGTARKTLGFPA